MIFSLVKYVRQSYVRQNVDNLVFGSRVRIGFISPRSGERSYNVSPPRSGERCFILTFVLLLVVTFAHSLRAQDPAVQKSDSGSTTLIVVVGAGGQEEYAAEFSQWADKWAQLAKQQQWNLVTIGGQPAPIDAAVVQAGQPETDSATDAVKLQQAIANLQTVDNTTGNREQSVEAVKRLWVVLIGHGTAMGKVAKFNLTGPDVTTTQLKSWLDKVPHDTVVVDCTSSSAPFLVELSAKKRVVVTATRSSGEINYARFGRYMAEAIGDIAADLDHDKEVSLLEAFLKASKDTERFYRDNARLATEHALLDDNHDRVGTSASFYVGSIATTAASEGKAVDGKRAARIILWSSPESLPMTAEQAGQREQIENEIDKLREQKSKLAEADYYQQLEALLVKLSAIYDQAEQKE